MRAAKSELLRVVAGEDAHGPAVVPDPRGTATGRGAHLHPTITCLELAERIRAFPRALRTASAGRRSGAVPSRGRGPSTLSTVGLREHLMTLGTSSS